MNAEPIETYTLAPARYAKDMFVLTSPRSTDGFKTELHWLAEACGGRWTHRDCGYQLTANQAKTFETLQHNGWEGKIRLSKDMPALVEKDGRIMPPREAAKL